MIVVATEYEKKLIQNRNDKCIVTGVGMLNVINALSDVDKSEPIFNVGYAGSNCIPRGTRVRVGKVRQYHPNVKFDELSYVLDGNVPCYTAGDFVTGTDIKEPCVFDMELAVILAMGFENVTAEKVVSDNLSVREFNECKDKQK